jgi:hypothetical protein
MKRFLLTILLTVALFLAACSPAAATPEQTNPQPTPAPSKQINTQLVPASPEPADPSEDLARSDAQGAVTVSVTPLNLNNPSEQLEFDISLETHSVDLSMDLATLSTLTTDTGLTILPTTWDAPRGGHHVQGKLIFPATQDGKSILEGASKLTLTITNVDASTRVFEWQLQ